MYLCSYAAEVGINLMTFDNEAELHKIKEYFPTAELVLRIVADDPTAVVQVRQMAAATTTLVLMYITTYNAMDRLMLTVVCN